MDLTVGVVLLGLVVGGVLGWFVPALIRRIPEPPPEAEESDVAAERDLTAAAEQAAAPPTAADREAAGGETARGEAAGGEAAGGEAARGEAARGEAARGEAARGETARGEAAGAEAAGDEPAPVVSANGEPAKEPYAEIAATPGLAGRCALTGAMSGGLVAAAVGADWPLLLWWPLLPVGVALAVVDWRTRLLPRLLVLPATGFAVLVGGLAAVADGDYDAWVRGLLGLLVARSVFWLLWRLHSAGMGFGDVRLAALLGFLLAFSGWPEWLVGLYAGFLVFALPGLALAVVRRDRALLRTAYPFGPFMLAGALAGLLAGPAFAGGLAS